MMFSLQSFPSPVCEAVFRRPDLRMEGTVFEKWLSLANSPKSVAGRS